MLSYNEIVENRRTFSLLGYSSLADVGFDGDWVTPYQMSSAHLRVFCFANFKPAVNVACPPESPQITFSSELQFDESSRNSA